jgi:3'(2'), 5'-bisphosphate nucleotidase
MAYEKELAVATRLARQAGAKIRGYFGTGLAVDHKAGDEPVTRADREASELIVAGLREAFPTDVIISEEAADDRRRLDPGVRVWFIDPLDGTKDFISGRPGFAVMIGLCAGARPVAGVVYEPMGDRLFVAARGHGGTIEDARGTRPLRCSDVDDFAKIRLVASASYRTSKIDEVKSTLGIRDEMQVGSVGLKLGLIASAERDLYVNPSSKSKAWDTCAPEALLVEAGGRITDVYGDALHYDRPELANTRGLVATNGRLHDAVIAKMAPLFPRPRGS